MDTCIAIIMYCQRLFLLFTLKKIKRNLPATNICVHAKFQFGGVTVLAVQLFNKIKKKKRKKKKKKMMKKNLKKHVSLYFPHVISKYIYFW